MNPVDYLPTLLARTSKWREYLNPLPGLNFRLVVGYFQN